MNSTPSGHTPPTNVDGMSSERHLVDYLRVLYKRRWVAIPVFVIVFTTAAINSLRATPVYDATARILIENDSPAVSGLDELFRASDSWYQGEFYETQYRILQSRSLARRTIQDLGLLGHPQFVDVDAHTADVPGTLWSTLTARVRG